MVGASSDVETPNPSGPADDGSWQKPTPVPGFFFTFFGLFVSGDFILDETPLFLLRRRLRVSKFLPFQKISWAALGDFQKLGNPRTADSALVGQRVEGSTLIDSKSRCCRAAIGLWP